MKDILYLYLGYLFFVLVLIVRLLPSLVHVILLYPSPIPVRTLQYRSMTELTLSFFLSLISRGVIGGIQKGTPLSKAILICMAEPNPARTPRPGANGKAYSATYYAGPLGLELVDAAGGLCMLSADAEPGTQSVKHGVRTGDYVTSVAGRPLGAGGCRGVKGLKSVLRKAPRPLRVEFFRFTTSGEGEADAISGDIPPPPPPPKHLRGNSRSGSQIRAPPRKSLFGVLTKKLSLSRAPAPAAAAAPRACYHQNAPKAISVESKPDTNAGNDFYSDVMHTPVHVSITNESTAVC